MKSIFDIKFISAEDCLDLRSRVLRPGQSLDLCKFTEDHFATTFHLGVFVGSTIVSNGTFMLNQNTDLPTAKNPYRLRGMATDLNYQGQNLGSALIQHAEIILKNKNCDLLWFNAREKAFSFYQKNGFTPHGEMFDIHLVGPHKVMYKWL